jgi:hypothetical protein
MKIVNRSRSVSQKEAEWLVVVVSQVTSRNDSLSDQLNMIDQEMSHE